nr:hypothetical protein Iba_chr06fCG8670 [Ipomoea batatas]
MFLVSTELMLSCCVWSMMDGEKKEYLYMHAFEDEAVNVFSAMPCPKLRCPSILLPYLPSNPVPGCSARRAAHPSEAKPVPILPMHVHVVEPLAIRRNGHRFPHRKMVQAQHTLPPLLILINLQSSDNRYQIASF